MQRYDEAFELITNLPRLNNVDTVVAGVQAIVARYGIDKLLFAGLAEVHFDQSVLANRWPDEFFALYLDNDYIRFDPIARRCRGSSRPFEWKAVEYHADPAPRAAEVMQRASDFGLAHGFIVPINRPEGFEACVSMSGTHVDLTERTKPLLHLVALYSYERVRQLARQEPLARPQLTAREREVLQWVAVGKSAWETGEILAIGKRTVEQHVATAVHKLGAVNRPHAIAIALRDKLITL